MSRRYARESSPGKLRRSMLVAIEEYGSISLPMDKKDRRFRAMEHMVERLRETYVEKEIIRTGLRQQQRFSVYKLTHIGQAAIARLDRHA